MIVDIQFMRCFHENGIDARCGNLHDSKKHGYVGQINNSVDILNTAYPLGKLANVDVLISYLNGGSVYVHFM